MFKMSKAVNFKFGTQMHIGNISKAEI